MHWPRQHCIPDALVYRIEKKLSKYVQIKQNIHVSQKLTIMTDRAKILNEFPDVSVNVRILMFLTTLSTVAEMHFKVWIAVTSFLHFICQQDISSGDTKPDQLGAQSLCRLYTC